MLVKSQSVCATLLLCALLGNTSIAGKYDTLSEDEVYETFGTQFKGPIVEDEALKAQPDIKNYLFTSSLSKDPDLLDAYAKFRIRAKKEEGMQPMHPDLMDEDVIALQNDPSFLQDFRIFLRLFAEEQYYSSLDARAVDLSRPPREPDGPLQPPQINPEIRKSNRTFASAAEKASSDIAYKPLQAYFVYLEEQNKNSLPKKSFESFKNEDETLKTLLKHPYLEYVHRQDSAVEQAGTYQTFMGWSLDREKAKQIAEDEEFARKLSEEGKQIAKDEELARKLSEMAL